MPEATLHVLHPPGADAAFLFFPIALWKLDSGGGEIENPILPLDAGFGEASRGAADLIATPVHAYAHLIDRYEIFTCRATPASGPAVACSAGRADSPQDGGEEQMSTWLLKKKRLAPDGTLSNAGMLSGLFDMEIKNCTITTGRVAVAPEIGSADAGSPRASAESSRLSCRRFAPDVLL